MLGEWIIQSEKWLPARAVKDLNAYALSSRSLGVANVGVLKLWGAFFRRCPASKNKLPRFLVYVPQETRPIRRSSSSLSDQCLLERMVTPYQVLIPPVQPF